MNSARRLNERLAGRFNYLYGSDDGSGDAALGGAGSGSGSASSSTVSSSLSLAAADSGFGDDALPSPPSEQQPPPVSVKKLKETVSRRSAPTRRHVASPLARTRHCRVSAVASR